MKKSKKAISMLGLILCTCILLSSSVFAIPNSNSDCPRCKWSVKTTEKIRNVGDMYVVDCVHGNKNQKDVMQKTEVTVVRQCNRCAFYEDYSYESSYLVGHLLYTD